MTLLMLLLLAAKCASPCGCDANEEAVRCEARAVATALERRDVPSLLAWVGSEGVACGDVRLSRETIERILKDRTSWLHAWLLDEAAFRKLQGDAPFHSLAYMLGKEQLLEVRVQKLAPDQWNAIYRHRNGFRSVIFRWRSGRFWVVSGDLFCG